MEAAFALAADTGQRPEAVLWSVSYPELILWQHCQQRAAGEWTVEPVATTTIGAQLRALENFTVPDEGEL